MGEMRQKSKVAAKDKGEQMRTDNDSKVLGGAHVPYWDPSLQGNRGCRVRDVGRAGSEPHWMPVAPVPGCVCREVLQVCPEKGSGIDSQPLRLPKVRLP